MAAANTLGVAVNDGGIIRGRRTRAGIAQFPTSTKLRGLQVRSISTDVGYNWSTIQAQIDKAVAVGANAIKYGALSGPVVTGAQTLAAWQTQTDQWCDYAAGQGLKVYLWIADGFTSKATYSAVNAPALAAYSQIGAYLHGKSNIVGIDMGNEINHIWGTADSVAHCAALRPALLRVTDLPLSTGLSCGNINQAFADDKGAHSLAPYCDFMDFHPYWASGNLTPQNVLDWWRTQPVYKPWIIGECGQEVGASSPTQAERWASLGLLAAMPDCFGVFGYTTFDVTTTTSTDHGMYTQDGLTERTAVKTAFQAWPASA